MAAYYNEIDPFAAAWLRELIKAHLIADGEVDERSIVDVRPDDLRGFVQCHFFAGIGGWSYALRLAGWPDDRDVWTGSCPCQPFSSAGAQAGGDDPRDLWPVWFQLVKECRPVVVFGEQVEAAIGHGWIDRLCDDLEAEDYAIGACGLPGPSVGAFDIRSRLWFVAHSECDRREGADDNDRRGAASDRQGPTNRHRDAGAVSRMADAEHTERRSVGGHLEDERDGRDSGRPQAYGEPRTCGAVSELADANSKRRQQVTESASRDESQNGRQSNRNHVSTGNGENGMADSDERRCEVAHLPIRSARQSEPAPLERRPSLWSACDWIPCADGKTRPVEPGTFPLAHGIPARVGRLRGYGNAIKPQVAQVFIEAYMDARGIARD